MSKNICYTYNQYNRVNKNSNRIIHKMRILCKCRKTQQNNNVAIVKRDKMTKHS